MIRIHFGGWAQCRLATDPDPYDEPRGVSGYIRAFVGEPDLDRIIRFNDPPLKRAHTQDIGVKVRAVHGPGGPLPGHPLVGALVDLVGGAKFEGRNGAIAEDGSEPIYPFDLKISLGSEHLSRSTVPDNPADPYREFLCTGATTGEFERIVAATGIRSIVRLWRERLAKLESDLATASEPDRPALEERIDFLQRIAVEGGGVARFYTFLMPWNYALRSKADFSAGAPALVGEDLASDAPWQAQFWFGGWDADAQAFFVDGDLIIGGPAALPKRIRRPERMSDLGRDG